MAVALTGIQSEVYVQIDSVRIGDRKRSLGDIISLAQSIKELGLINAITILPDNTLVTGYHRLEACKSLGWQSIRANVTDLSTLDAELAEIDENIIRNELHWFDRDRQLARRKEIYEVKYPGSKQGSKGGWHNNKAVSLENETVSFSSDTASKIGVSDRTIELSIQRADAFTEEQGELLKRAEITQTEATKIARLEEPQRMAVIEAIADIADRSSTGQTERVSLEGILPGLVQPRGISPLYYDSTREVAEHEQIQKRIEAKERIAQLRENGVNLPVGKYSCLIVDPPWPMQKIERDVRPNQVEFDYPTMDEEELKAFPLPDVSADDCHLYLWTTQKHLPMALRLAEHWGFRYQCLLTWVKNVGFTPFSWMYSTEHVLFCRKGNLPLLRMGVKLHFHADVREHSRKPDEFYQIVREVSPGPRLDVFSREKREGFEQHGNEVEKYVSA